MSGFARASAFCFADAPGRGGGLLFGILTCSSATAPRGCESTAPRYTSQQARLRGWAAPDNSGLCRPESLRGMFLFPVGDQGVTQGGLVPLEIAPASAGFVTPAGVTAIGGPPLACSLPTFCHETESRSPGRGVPLSQRVFPACGRGKGSVPRPRARPSFAARQKKAKTRIETRGFYGFPFPL